VPRAAELVISLPSAADVLLPRLCDYLGRADPTARGPQAIVDALATLGDKAAVPALIEALSAAVRAGHSPMIESALQALRDFGPAAAHALDMIRALAQRADIQHVAVGALWAVGRDPDETVPPLLQLLDDDTRFRIWRAADLLAEIGPAAAAALPGLRNRLSDPYHWTQVLCAQALWAVGGEHEAPAVIHTLVRAAAEHPVTTENTVESFTRMTAAASPALAQLRAELDDPSSGGRFTTITADETLREIARSVINKVDDN
jgi:HEAT repeat protein